MTWAQLVELGRAVYAAGLLALGLAAVLVAPVAVRVLRDLTAALAATARALAAISAERDAVARVEEAAGRLEAAAERIERRGRA
jgi:glutamine synthetase type III